MHSQDQNIISTLPKREKNISIKHTIKHTIIKYLLGQGSKFFLFIYFSFLFFSFLFIIMRLVTNIHELMRYWLLLVIVFFCVFRFELLVRKCVLCTRSVASAFFLSFLGRALAY